MGTNKNEVRFSSNTQLILAGSVAIDTIRYIPHSIFDLFKDLHPRFSLSLLIDEKEEFRGGTGANIAYTLSLLGEQPILLAAVSHLDREYVAYLEKIGITTEYLYESSQGIPAFDVITFLDTTQFATFYSGAMKDSDKLTLLPWSCASDKQDVYAIISAHDPLAMHTQVNQCRSLGIPYCFDIGQQTNNSTLGLIIDGVAGAHILIANEHEITIIAEKLGMTVDVLEQSVPICITTLGKDGARIAGYTVDGYLDIPITQVSNVLDPTGAGDAWRGGFFAGLKRGFSLFEAGLWGSVAAAYAVESHGAQEHTYSVGEFFNRLDDLKRRVSFLE